MSSWQSGDIEVNGVKLHYTRTGGRTAAAAAA